MSTLPEPFPGPFLIRDAIYSGPAVAIRWAFPIAFPIANFLTPPKDKTRVIVGVDLEGRSETLWARPVDLAVEYTTYPHEAPSDALASMLWDNPKLQSGRCFSVDKLAKKFAAKLDEMSENAIAYHAAVARLAAEEKNEDDASYRKNTTRAAGDLLPE